MAEQSQQQRDLKIQEFSGSDLATVVQEVRDFWTAGDKSVSPAPETTESRMIDWEYQVDGGTHYIVLIYTE